MEFGTVIPLIFSAICDALFNKSKLLKITQNMHHIIYSKRFKIQGKLCSMYMLQHGLQLIMRV